MDRPRRSVEQIEVIEHRIVEEGRRPISGGPSAPFSTVRTTHEQFEVRGDDPIIDRYRATGETDVSREQSFLHTSANYGQQIEVTPPRLGHSSSGGALNISGQSGHSGHRVEFADETMNTVVNNFGYDVHEVHTSGGGARVVETHGSGPFRDHSRTESTARIDEAFDRPGITSALRSGAVNGLRTEPSASAMHDSWRSSDKDSFVRQDSYKRMQRSDDMMSASQGSRTGFVPRSQTSLVTRSDAQQPGCWQRTKLFFIELIDQLRTANWTPRLIASLCCILFLLLLLLIILIIIFRAIFARYSVNEFLLFPPVCEECRRKNPALVSAAMPSSVFVHFYSSEQAHFELRGNPPFKSNSFTAIDFSTGYVAFADHALTDSNGRHTTCFLMPLDRAAIGSMDQLMEAVTDSDSEIQSTFGWQEFWQFDAQPIESITARNKFTEPIADCENAKWYLLKQTVHASDLSCSDCYDFCLPDWAVVRKEKYDDYSTLGIRRLNCFRFYVPEWRNYRVVPDANDGHFKYPLASVSTKRDKHGEWVSWVPTQYGQRSVQRRR